MDTTRLKQLAGLPAAVVENEMKTLELLNEVVELPDDITMEELIQRLDACKRALSIVHKMTDPADKKKWMSATFVNLNKVRGALQRMLAKVDAANTATGGDALAASRLTSQA